MFCKNCGKQLPDDSAFCGFCGTQLGGGASGQRPPQPGQNPQMTLQYPPPAPGAPQYQQVPYQQPAQGQFQQAQNTQQGAPRKLRSVGKIAGIAAVAAVVVIAAAVILPKVTGGIKEGKGGKGETPPSGITGITVNPAGGEQNSGVTGDDSGSLLTLPGSGPTSSGGQDGQTTQENVNSEGMFLPSKTAEELGTSTIPTLEDFSWFLDDQMISGVPSDAEDIHDTEDMIGYWKCLVFYDPMNTEGKFGYHLATARFDARLDEDGTVTGTVAIFWNTCIDANGAVTDESGKSPFACCGHWTDGWFGLEDGGDMAFRLWTTGDGKQYALGAGHLPDVDANSVVFVRP